MTEETALAGRDGESRLTQRLIAAANAAKDCLAQPEIDRILGVQPRHGER